MGGSEREMDLKRRVETREGSVLAMRALTMELAVVISSGVRRARGWGRGVVAVVAMLIGAGWDVAWLVVVVVVVGRSQALAGGFSKVMSVSRGF